jgi:2-polyprenyl-3-methyl-5-hydroxy-6-metoxy-1,4-benzoquinol methylase
MKKMMKFLDMFSKKTKNSFVDQTEAEFYEHMFVKNPSWNKPSPNSEEILRWNIIEGFLKYVYNNNIELKPSNYNILDLGCGRGWLTNLLSKYGNIVGIEPVKPVLDYAKKMFPHLEFICGTTKDLIKDNSSFNKYNLIVVSEVIEHIPDSSKEEFIEDISKLLNEKGFLILTTPRKEVQEVWNKYMNPNQPIEDWIMEKDLEELIVQKSFLKHKIERFSIPPVEGAPEIEIYQLWLFQKN